MSGRYLKLIFFSVAALVIAACSSEGGQSLSDSFEVSFTLPSSIDVPSDTREYVFKVTDGKAPLISDVFMLTSGDGVSVVCPILNVSSTEFTVRFDVEEGTYEVFIKRGNQKKSKGKVLINFVERLDFTPDPGTTVYGIVTCDGEGVPGVVVSDGSEVTVTDEDGLYQLKSQKKWNYVFISVPSGYEVPADGVFPKFYSLLHNGKDELDRADFSLEKVDQSSYSMLFFGDMHLANRSTDHLQFQDFTDDVNDYLAANGGKKVYAATLGDMTWDYYWYNVNMPYDIDDYIQEINDGIKGLQIFHTMGNHDNDYMTLNDFDAATKYVSKIAPTFYSFNIGGIHYVVLDDINCSRYDGTVSRDYYTDVTAEQLSWLAKDLAHVDPSTPVTVLAHAQIFSTSGMSYKLALSNAEELMGVLSGYKVHFVTGHTHRVYSIVPQDAVTSGRDIHEHNSGAVCATWWYTGDATPGIHISQDGAPGGYAVWDINGTDMKWRFKATRWPDSYQFRAYDLNNVSFTLDDVPNMPDDFAKDFRKYMDAYPVNSDNEVLINVWNWNSLWEVTVTDEDGKPLDVERVLAYDPLHIKALAVPKFNNSSLTSTPGFMASQTAHMFKVRLDDPDTDITITVKDDCDNTWSEVMERPKDFSVQEYKYR